MMTRVILLVAVLLLVLATVASANNRDFIFVNDTRLSVNDMWTSTSDATKWYHVGGQVIPPGGSTDVDFESSGPCQVQLRFLMSDGSKHEFDDGVNLCHVLMVKLEFSDSDGYYWVESK